MKKFIFLICAVYGLAGCGGDAKKLADMKVLNLDDVGKEIWASEGAKAKYDGKEFVVIGTAGMPLGEYPTKGDDGKYYYSVYASSNSFPLNCMVAPEDKAKFDGIERGATIAVKGTLRAKSTLTMDPCTRDFRDSK